MALFHIGALSLDADSQRSTPWQGLTPQARILCVAVLVLAIALTPNGHWLTWGVYSIGILAALLISQVTFSILLKRLAVELSFVSVVLLGTLFRGGGEVLWQWGFVSITTTGVMILGSVTLKALLSLLLLNLLTLTTSVPDLLQGLAILKMPGLLVAILASMYRYIAVLMEEFTAMRRAALSRNLMGTNRWERLVVGNMIGSLFIRTYERGERVYLAMLSRGYQGLPLLQEKQPHRRFDVVALTLTVLFAITGQAITWLA
jgi:cobalt/nickel transport system permease protein